MVRSTNKIVQEFPDRGIFLTGIEGSDPWVGGKRRNQLLEAHNFLQHWETRLQNIKDLGITWLRFGPPYSQTHLGREDYDFSLCEKVINRTEELGITLVIDLLHFGLPEWLHEHKPDEPFFQNQDFPKEFAEYVGVFARRFPQIKYFTLVNEPFITANFSAKLGIWNETRPSSWDKDDHFVRAIANIAKAAILAKEKIYEVWKEGKRSGSPVFVQNESFEVAIASSSSNRRDEALQFNMRRFAGLDLIFGLADPQMKKYLLAHGLSDKEYEWFIKHGSLQDTVLGIDHYPTCVHRYRKHTTVDESPRSSSKLYRLVKEYWERYHLPMLHTETNAWPSHAVNICKKTYEVINKLRSEGYPVLGMGWYGDEYQVGWHFALYGPLSFEESPVGLYYKGKIQPVGKLFQKLAEDGLVPLAV
jgi:beta-glucosidase